MLRSQGILFGVLVLIALFGTSQAKIVRYQKEFLNGIDGAGRNGSEMSVLSCECANGTRRTTFLNRQTVEELIEDEMNYETCKKNFKLNVCNRLAFCNNCFIYFKKCFSSTEHVKSHCVKELYVLLDGYFKSLNSNKTRKDFNYSSEFRFKRNVNACGHPTNMKTADVACHSTPSLVKCTQYCIFGHTLKGGAVKKMQCKTRDNKWLPSGFSECQPFVDCTLNLVSPGSVDCYTATTKQAPQCHVSCTRYEDKEAVPKSTYVCRLDGSWSKELPYCVHPGSGIAIVPKPPNISDFPYIDDE